MEVKFLTVACLSVGVAAGMRGVVPSKGHIVETFQLRRLLTVHKFGNFCMGNKELPITGVK